VFFKVSEHVKRQNTSKIMNKALILNKIIEGRVWIT
jgi:hypothetical protein